MDALSWFVANPNAMQAVEAVFRHLISLSESELDQDIVWLQERAESEVANDSVHAPYWSWLLEIVIDYRNGRLAETEKET